MDVCWKDLGCLAAAARARAMYNNKNISHTQLRPQLKAFQFYNIVHFDQMPIKGDAHHATPPPGSAAKSSTYTQFIVCRSQQGPWNSISSKFDQHQTRQGLRLASRLQPAAVAAAGALVLPIFPDLPSSHGYLFMSHALRGTPFQESLFPPSPTPAAGQPSSLLP